MLENMPKGKKILYKILLFLPLALAIAWLAYIKTAEKTAGMEGTFLSPINNAPIITALIIFIIGYLLFLLMMFFSDIKNMLSSIKQK